MSLTTVRARVPPGTRHPIPIGSSGWRTPCSTGPRADRRHGGDRRRRRVQGSHGRRRRAASAERCPTARAAVTVTATTTATGGASSTTRSRGATRSATQATDRFAALADELAHRCPDRTEQAYPLRLRAGGPALRPPGGARPRAASTPPPTTGRTRAATAASTGRSASVQARAPFILGRRRRAPARPRAPRRAGSSTWPPPCSPCWAPRRRRAGSGLNGRRSARRPAAPPGRRGARRAARPASRPPTHVVGSCSTAPTPTCSTTWPRGGEAPNVARLMAMGTTFGPRRDVVAADRHAGQPHVDPHRRPPRPPRHPPQRLVRPGRPASR